MTTVTELKELFIKLGGDPEKVKGLQTDAEVIDLLKTTNLGIELPTTTTEDEGKILQVDSEGNWDKADAPIELPSATTEDEGKILQVDSEGSWDKADAPIELPAVTSEDNGKILKVSDGVWGAFSSDGVKILKESINSETTNATGSITTMTKNRIVVGIVPKSDFGSAGKIVIPYYGTPGNPNDSYVNFKILNPSDMSAYANQAVSFDYYYFIPE